MREITAAPGFNLPARSEKQIASNVLKGSLGNLIEWFDWYVYASFAIYFSGAFFPAGNQTAQLLASAGVFAIGFFMRPLGSLVMGRLADRHGRRTALTVSVLIMATGSLIIALVPTYATIGLWSPLILILTRLLQGLSLGGEYGTSATYLSEMASPHRRGFYASFQYVTLIAGQLLALLVQIVLQKLYTNAQLTAFGWRIPFAIGAVGALVVLWLRLSMEESDQFTRRNQHQANAGTLRLLLRYPKQAFGLMVVALIVVSGYTSINAIVKAELFPSEIRALGVGLPYGLTVALFGGTVNYVALWLRSLHHESLFFWYVSAAAFISLCAYLFLLKGHRSQFTTEA